MPYYDTDEYLREILDEDTRRHREHDYSPRTYNHTCPECEKIVKLHVPDFSFTICNSCYQQKCKRESVLVFRFITNILLMAIVLGMSSLLG